MKKRRQRGFTLIELLISMLIFIIIVGGVVNVLLTSITFQQRIMADQKMLAEISFTLEYMSRTLAMAQKDTGGTCISVNHNYEGSTSTIRFLNFDNECQEFLLEGNAIKERIANSSSSSHLPLTPSSLTSGNIIVTNLVFDRAESTWSSPANNQSKVVISLKVKPKTGDSDLSLQTVVSQRRLNITF